MQTKQAIEITGNRMEHITSKEEKKRIEADKRIQAIRDKYLSGTESSVPK